MRMTKAMAGMGALLFMGVLAAGCEPMSKVEEPRQRAEAAATRAEDAGRRAEAGASRAEASCDRCAAMGHKGSVNK
jgi:hypothetical protein